MLPGERWNSNISKAPEQEGVTQPKTAFPFLQSPSPFSAEKLRNHLVSCQGSSKGWSHSSSPDVWV